jgi:hypothetical protein
VGMHINHEKANGLSVVCDVRHVRFDPITLDFNVLLNPEAFQACFVRWLASLRAKAAAATGIEQPVLAIDGKTLRRSHDSRKDLGALHSVSVWASEFGLSLGQVACAEKSNEITAIPELLRFVDIKGAIITIDAMGTQKAIAEQIIDRGADYVLALKGNQETLHQAVIDYIDEQRKYLKQPTITVMPACRNESVQDRHSDGNPDGKPSTCTLTSWCKGESQMKKPGLLLAIGVLICLVAFAIAFFYNLLTPHGRINKDSFTRIQEGMKEEEVTQILGAMPTESSPGGLELIQRSWVTDDCVITLLFHLNGTVVEKLIWERDRQPTMWERIRAWVGLT